MTWQPRLDETDHAIMARLSRLGRTYLTLRDVGDAPETSGVETPDLLARLDILAEAGLIRRVDHFVITKEGAELIEQAAGRADDATDQLGTVVVSDALSPDASPPAESVEVAA